MKNTLSTQTEKNIFDNKENQMYFEIEVEKGETDIKNGKYTLVKNLDIFFNKIKNKYTKEEVMQNNEEVYV